MGSLQLLFIHVMLLIKPLTNDEHGGGSLERCIIGDRQYGQISDDQHHRQEKRQERKAYLCGLSIIDRLLDHPVQPVVSNRGSCYVSVVVDQVSILTKQGKGNQTKLCRFCFSSQNYQSFDFGLREGAGLCQSEQGWIEDIHEVSLIVKNIKCICTIELRIFRRNWRLHNYGNDHTLMWIVCIFDQFRHKLYIFRCRDFGYCVNNNNNTHNNNNKRTVTETTLHCCGQSANICRS